MNLVEGWSLELAEDVDLPGWVHLPGGMSGQDEQRWLTEVSGILMEIVDPPPSGTSGHSVHDILQAGLDARATSPSYLMYLVWPVASAAAVMCHVNLVASKNLPDWPTLDGTLHAADARYVGPGLQFSTRRAVESADGPVELNSVHFAFDDGEIGLMLTLEESVSPLVSRALVGFVFLKDALRLIRDDGSVFASVPPAALVEDSTWRPDES